MRPARTLRAHSFFAHATCHPRQRRPVRVLSVGIVAPGPSDRQSVLWGLLSRPAPLCKDQPPCVGGATKLARQFERFVAFRAWGHHADSSKASAARLSQSSLPSKRGVSLLMAPESSRCLHLLKSLDGRTLIEASLFPRSIALGHSKVPYAAIARASRRCATIWSGTGLAMEYSEIAYRHERPVNQRPTRWGNAQEPPPAYG